MIKGFVASSFDLGPHAGHLAMLQEAKQHCDHLIAALHVDPSAERGAKNKPVQSVSERYFALRGCRFIDEIIPYETEEELRQILLLTHPDVRFLGDDYIDQDFTGSDIDTIQIHFCSRRHSISSSNLRKKIKEIG